MRVLVAGASGFIGHALAEALAREGHEVIRASRHASGRGALAVDFAAVPPEQWWTRQLAGVHAVVNAVGIVRESPAQRFESLHTRAPVELFRACAAAGVGCVIQVSALGADAQAQTRYHLSKKAADDALRALPLRGAIVQPSLVYGPGGASARLFETLAACPVLALPRQGRMQLQPVHLDDVIEGLLALLRAPPQGMATIAFVGARALALRDYVARLRRQLGIGRGALVLPFPPALFMAFAAIAGRVPGSLLDADTARMLLRGNTGDPLPFARLLGREPRAVESFVDARDAPARRIRAVLAVWLPVLRIALAALWIWTGIVSCGLYPVQGSLALLARVGLHDAAALVALYAAAGLDLAIGAGLLLPRRARRWLWPAQLALIAGYTLLITVFLPEYWLHPYGPISKNLPLMAAIALMGALEQRGTR
jgi:uncharacterized protein YbjT (DUF2867 family)